MFGRTRVEQVYDAADRGGLAALAAILVPAVSISSRHPVSTIYYESASILRLICRAAPRHDAGICSV